VREIAAKANYRWGHEDGFAEGRDTGFAEGRDTGFAEGRDTGFAEGHDEGLLAAVRGLVRRRGWSADEAMDVVDIPEDERPRYVALLARP
jgi:flagellar biosynthesis/type III secretory pathway protein FliH